MDATSKLLLQPSLEDDVLKRIPRLLIALPADLELLEDVVVLPPPGLVSQTIGLVEAVGVSLLMVEFGVSAHLEEKIITSIVQHKQRHSKTLRHSVWLSGKMTRYQCPSKNEFGKVLPSASLNAF